jgi:hypothetical protein
MKKRPLIITKRNAITFPKQLCEKHDLQPGDCFDYEVLKSGAILLTRKECCQPPAFQPICRIAKTKECR